MIKNIQIIPKNILLLMGVGIFIFLILYKFFPSLFLKVHKPVFFIIGILSLSLGYIGVVIPGLPTTVFILISAWAFSKCSTRLTHYLENHKIFGSIIKNWQMYRGLSRRGKKMALLMIIPTFILTIFIAFSLIGDLIFGLFGILLCTWLISRPEPPLKTD